MPVTRTELKNVKALQSASGRREQRLFVAEGIRVLEEALRHHRTPEAVFYCENELSERGEKLLSLFRAGKVRTEPVSSRQITSVSEARTSQGMIAIFGLPDTSATELFESRHRRILLCEGISDPGNLGTLIRSARAFGFDLAALAGQSVDPYSPKVVRSTAGALFGEKICFANEGDVDRLLASPDVVLIAASHRGETDLYRLKSAAISDRLVLAIGSESEGLSDSIMQKADLVWRIKHGDAVESLNAAVAGSIIMKQLFDFMD